MRYIAIIIHGTFDKNSKFIRENSEFCTWLRNDLRNVHIDPFDWSGKNSITERQLAGELLAKRIKEMSLSDPEAQIILVAHSHGGNIIRYALSYPLIEIYVHKIVFLGTPFLKTQEKDFGIPSLFSDLSLNMTFKTKFGLIILGFTALFSGVREGIIRDPTDTISPEVICIFIILLFVAGIKMISRLTVFWDKILKKYDENFQYFMNQEFRANKSKIPMLSVTYDFDEAFVGLKGISMLLEKPIPFFIMGVFIIASSPLILLMLIKEYLGTVCMVLAFFLAFFLSK